MGTPVTKRILALILLISGLAASGLLAWRYRHIAHLGRFDDDAVYAVCARSLAEGHGYRIRSLPNEPAQTLYPPLFPALLSLVWRWNPSFPENLTWITPILWIMVPALCALSLALFWKIGFDWIWSLALAALIAANPVVAIFGVSVMTELFGAVLVLASLWLGENARNSRWVAAAGVFGGLAYLCRTAALPLLIVVPACFIWKRRYRHASIYAAAMLPAVIGWLTWSSAHRIRTTDPALMFQTDYLGFYLNGMRWTDLPEMISTNLASFINCLSQLIVFQVGESGVAFYISYVAGLTLAIATGSLLFKMRRFAPSYGAFCAVYCFLLLIWWCPPNERFVLPLLPFVLAGAATLIRDIASQMPWRGFANALPVAAIAAVVCMNTYALYVTVPLILDTSDREMAEARTAYEWAARNTAPDTRFYAYNPALFNLYTGRTAMVPRVRDETEGRTLNQTARYLFRNIPAFAREHDLKYGVVTNSDLLRHMSRPEARTVLQSLSAQYPHAYSSNTATVLQFQLP